MLFSQKVLTGGQTLFPKNIEGTLCYLIAFKFFPATSLPSKVVGRGSCVNEISIKARYKFYKTKQLMLT